MKDGIHFEAFKHPDRWAREFNVTMCIADNTKTHTFYPCENVCSQLSVIAGIDFRF
jgi:hypothetical protein